MGEIIDGILGTYTSDNRERVTRLLHEVKDKAKEFSRYSINDEKFFKDKTSEFKRRLQRGETKDDILVEALALCVRAMQLKLGISEVYDTQLIAAIAMQDNVIAEMKTGEGKTFVQILAGYVNALNGGGVHIATANDYLAERDYTENKSVFELLGLSVGLARNNFSKVAKREAYTKDVVYSTMRNIAFDYLRDNIVRNKKDKVMSKPFNYVVIDEADNTLIDEASTPIILSPDPNNTEYKDIIDKTPYTEAFEKIYTELVGGESKEPLDLSSSIEIFKRNPNLDYIYSPWNKAVYLSDKYNGDKILEDAISAVKFAQKGKSYILEDKVDDKGNIILGKNGLPLKKITLIDASTGRLAKGKQFLTGFHQAIEAKESYLASKEHKDYDVEFSNGLVALGICTYSDLLKLYKNGASGMTGTSSELLREIYGLQTYQVPTRKQNLRVDNSKIYITMEDKYEAMINNIEECYRIGRPVLVGTTSVEESKIISKMLEDRGIIHNVLNAENEAVESAIIKNAGQFKSVTVSTNMAGRGTDIKLSDKARALGGLYVIGSSRNKSSRLDNQLRGRASRQGDPGTTTYYSSLEDDRVTRFAGNMTVLKEYKKKEQEAYEKKTGMKLTDKSITSTAVDEAQEKDEALTREMIINTINYNEALVRQRENVYGFRNLILDSDNIMELISRILKESISRINDKDDLINRFSKYINIDASLNRDKIENIIYKTIMSEINNSSKINNYEEILRERMLKTIDDYWVTQIQELEIGKKMWRYESMTAKDPLEYYNLKAYNLFQTMIDYTYQEIIDLAINPNMQYTMETEEEFSR